MRVIFQNGSVVDLTNVNNIILDNEMERNIVALAVDIYDREEYDGVDQHETDQSGSDGYVSGESEVASES